MKSNRDYVRLSIITFTFVCLIHRVGIAQHGIVQDDTILAPNTLVAPVVDGKGDDACWQSVKWQPIAQGWIPYGAKVDSSIYWGRYKVIWSSTTDLLYFLMEVHDTIFVDGYIPGVTADIYNYDVSEIFIDENASGGEHRYDTDTSNAQNAFAYHMYAPCPADGQVTTALHVDDMAGTIANSHRADYTSHFPEYALRRIGQTAVREFSLIVYNDTYTDSNKDAARSQLTAGKLMGLSVAYCDNNHPNRIPATRDFMFGGDWEPSPGNMHWINASYFGHVKLVAENASSVENKQPISIKVLKLYPNPSSSSSQLEVENLYRGEVTIRLFNLLGQQIFRTSALKMTQVFTYSLHLHQLPPSPYFVQINMGRDVLSEKLLVIPK